ncbi:hypothetical protein GVAMD_0243 [Gardnerella vaginalis AMD]|nr:hypothetical protein GVAMD_0243 [Gardnerella vaginalis AMD]
MTEFLNFLDFVIFKLWKLQVFTNATTVGVWIFTNAEFALWHEGKNVFLHSALFIEELFRLVGLHPVLQNLEVSFGIASRCQWHLVCTPRTFGLLAIDELRAGPTLWSAEDNHWVVRTSYIVSLSLSLNIANFIEDSFEHVSKATVDGHMILIVEASNELVWFITHAVEELMKLLIGNTGKNCWVSNLIAVQVQDWKHDTIGTWVHKLVGLPTGSQRTGLSFTIANDCWNEQAWVVHNSAVSVRKCVTKLATFVDGTWGFRSEVRRNTAWVRELTEELLQTSFVLSNLWIVLSVSTVEVRLSSTSWAAVAWTHDNHGVLLVISDKTINVADKEVKTWSGAPVAHQTMLNVFASERLLH